MTYRKNRKVYGKKDDAAKMRFARQMCKVVSMFDSRREMRKRILPNPKIVR